MDQEQSGDSDEPRTSKTELKRPSKLIILTVALIVMTILTATLAIATCGGISVPSLYTNLKPHYNPLT